MASHGVHYGTTYGFRHGQGQGRGQAQGQGQGQGQGRGQGQGQGRGQGWGQGRGQGQGWGRGRRPQIAPRPLSAPRAATYAYYVVLDFEATCNDGPFPLHLQEVIEFPCVLVDARTTPATVTAEIQVYVRPEAVPVLTPFCTALTGITQATVDKAGTFAAALRQVLEWLRRHGLDPDHPTNFAVVTCGNWDLESMLPRQIKLLRSRGHRVPSNAPACFRQWVNVQDSFEQLYGCKAGGLKRMLATLKLSLDGRHHSGLDDCRNTAKIVAHLLRDGSPLTLTARADAPPPTQHAAHAARTACAARAATPSSGTGTRPPASDAAASAAPVTAAAAPALTASAVETAAAHAAMALPRKQPVATGDANLARGSAPAEPGPGGPALVPPLMSIERPLSVFYL